MASHAQERSRITARVPQHIKDDLQEAADRLGTQLNDFIVQSALMRAREVIDRDTVIHTTKRDAEILFDALENPREPNDKLKKAFQRAKEAGIV